MSEGCEQLPSIAMAAAAALLHPISRPVDVSCNQAIGERLHAILLLLQRFLFSCNQVETGSTSTCLKVLPRRFDSQRFARRRKNLHQMSRKGLIERKRDEGSAGMKKGYQANVHAVFRRRAKILKNACTNLISYFLLMKSVHHHDHDDDPGSNYHEHL
jgi:hypothetical protein